ncbi:MAG: 1-deoxy-D-xylulose-5-phosphate reductoisomerase [Clostridia bacterium]|nr:1-deoxy-D-xylulose-5-phosphate reductoisomerase [Clostridia bacterium]
MKELIILGSTGSIGTQSLEVARAHNIRVRALSAGSNDKLMERQAREFKPDIVALSDIGAARRLKIALKDTDIKVFSGEEGVIETAAYKGDIVLSAIVGIAGLKPTLAAINEGKDIALVNKETMVTGGVIVNKLAREKKVKILPVDSEHSAIFQSLSGAPNGSLKKILLTASGGPFFGKTINELKNVTAKEALKHPNWSMGAKITVDSATLMNKGLEVIEAVHLFGVEAKDIEVLVHRQSIVHSGVEFTDGAVIAQMGTPDMKVPIQYALTYPNRGVKFENLDLFKIGTLTFEKPDTETFRCLPLCIEAINRGGLYPTAINGANEESVRLFLEGKIGFLDIAEFNEKAMEKATNKTDFSVEDIFEADKLARQTVLNLATK